MCFSVCEYVFFSLSDSSFSPNSNLVWNEALPNGVDQTSITRRFHMFKAGLLWMMGVPFFVVVLLWMFFF